MIFVAVQSIDYMNKWKVVNSHTQEVVFNNLEYEAAFILAGIMNKGFR